MGRRTGISRGRAPFSVGVSDRAALLIHGIAACPAQLRGLAEYLAGRGIQCRAMLLPGHGGHYREMRDVTWHDWYAKAEREFLELRAGREQTSVVGFSIGAALAMELAANRPVDRLVLINTPLYYFFRFLPQRLMLGILNLLTKEIRTFGIGGSGENLILPRIPVRILYTMGELVHRERGRAGEITCPTLVVHSTRDLASRARSATHLMRRLASSEKQLVWVRDKDHSILQGKQRKEVFAKIESFLNNRAEPS
ncbi:MAG: hypothetical protein DRH15_15300 [Deltaproteobacteria bacterium]|nr:MAG: hypothetical protein DRH15_15300 [Deltaproteobacteria bacterium]